LALEARIVGRVQRAAHAAEQDADAGQRSEPEGLRIGQCPLVVPAPIVWTRFCNSGRLSQGISLADFKG
jgi:hypothetical protein